MSVIFNKQALMERLRAKEPVFAYADVKNGRSFCGWFKVRRVVVTNFRGVNGAPIYSATGEYVTGFFVGQTACALVPCFYTEIVKNPLVYAAQGGWSCLGKNLKK